MVMWHSDRKQWLLVWLVALVVLNAPRVRTQSSALPVVPGAAGFGMETRAAYGGGSNPAVLRVTNLNDSGTGSLRAALEAAGPRVVIFETSGTITLLSPIFIHNPYLTVAGQTAPSPGILIKSGANDTSIEIYTHDILFQHLRVRPGGTTCNSAIGAWYTNLEQPYNINFDHLSVSWAQDENFYIKSGHTPANFTVWRSISSEGLVQAPGSSGCSGGGLANGHGLLISEGTQSVAVLQSIFAHTLERTPVQKSGTKVYIANNITYDSQQGAAMLDPEQYGDAILVSAIGNYFKRGPSARDDYAFLTRYLVAGSKLYRSDNTIDNGGLTPAITPLYVIDGADPSFGSPPFTGPSGYVPMTSAATYTSVLANGGARPADRDSVDSRLITEIRNRTGGIISSPNQVGGYPTLAANVRSLTLPANPHIVTGSGYTNLELWLHGFSATVEGTTTVTSSPPAPPTGLRVVS
jgi:hypothetical protein